MNLNDRYISIGQLMKYNLGGDKDEKVRGKKTNNTLRLVIHHAEFDITYPPFFPVFSKNLNIRNYQ